MRAAIYARVSTERQERQQTIDSQLTALRDWARAQTHALAEVHVFRDEGYSGSRLDRPGLDGLRDAVRDAAIDVVAVLSPDRLARKYAYQVLLLEEFRRAGCEVAFLQRPISDDPNDQLLLQIQGAIAGYARAVLAERSPRGRGARVPGRGLPARQAPESARRAHPKRQGALRLPVRAPTRGRPGPPGRRRGRGRHGAPAPRVGDGGGPDRPPVREAAERRPLGHPVGASAVGALGGPPRPLRPGLHRHRLREPLRVRRAEEGPRPLAPQRRADLATSPAAGAVDRHPGAGPDRSAGLGQRPGPAGPQCGHVLPPRQEARLPAALPAEVRHLRVGHPRLLLSRAPGSARPALLPLRGHESPHLGP